MVLIQIEYTSVGNNHVLGDYFECEDRSHEDVAYEFWRKLKLKVPGGCILKKALINGMDYTEKIIKLDEVYKNKPYIPKDTQKAMFKFFMKTSIPRILAERRNHERRSSSNSLHNERK